MITWQPHTHTFRTYARQVASLRLVRIALVVLPLLVLVLTSTTTLSAQTPAEAVPDQSAEPRQLAQSIGRDLREVQLLDRAELTLRDGRHMTRLKALDRSTSQIVTIALADGEIVAEASLRLAAALDWRSRHGALSPEMVQRLAGMDPADRSSALLWLNVAVVPPLRSDSRATPADSASAGTQIEAERVERAAALRQQIAPVRARLLQRLQASGITVSYASEIVPLVYVQNLSSAQLDALAFLPEIDAIYPPPQYAGPALAVARPAQNADLLEDAGYTGEGVKVSVTEGQRAYEANPYLSLAGYYSATEPASSHPTAVAGIIGSKHPAIRGLAPDAILYNANGSITDLDVMLAAIDWGAITATVINNSWYWDSGAPTFGALDRQMDYLVRYNANFVAGAAGNFGNGCLNPGGFTTPYIVSPAKGYNVLTVGNYDDNDTLDWADDAMQLCSSYGDPGTDLTDTVHSKPEVAAIGTVISSTRVSSNTLTAMGPVGTGTSFATPMVSALAANLIQADPDLTARPAALRSIIMASALHNIEGDARLSDKDGAGGIDATAAVALVERGAWDDRVISVTTTFPITFTQDISAGERARFVINWLSNPAADYLAETLPTDLDLLVWRADGSTLITVSASLNDNFEVVDFIAPASEAYQFVISQTGDWAGAETWLGTAWWSGVTRLEPNTGYTYPQAAPLGEHFAVYPSDWTPDDRWRALGVRSSDSNHDLVLNSRSIFDDPGLRVRLTESHAISGAVDIIAVDGNHWLATDQEQYVVTPEQGPGGYEVNWSNRGEVLADPGRYGPYTMTNQDVVAVFDAFFDASQLRQISLEPAEHNESDLGMMLFRSDPETPQTWVQARGGQVAKADSSKDPAAIETLRYTHTLTQADHLGLVIYSNSAAQANFFLRVSLDQSIAFPEIADRVYDDPPFFITATASSNLTVTFEAASSNCQVSPEGWVTLFHTGVCAIVAHQPGDVSFNAAPPVTRLFEITPASQVIDFQVGDGYAYTLQPFPITATASSNLAVTFTSAVTTCLVAPDGWVTTTAVGVCTVTAHQAGDANYLAALDVTQSFTITQADQTIFFAPLPDRALSSPPFVISATAASGLPVTFTTTSIICEVTPDGWVSVLDLGVCAITAQQAGNENFHPAPDVERSFRVAFVAYLPVILR